MKSLLVAVLALVAVITAPLVQARDPLPPDIVLQGVKNRVPTGATLGVDGTFNVNTGGTLTLANKASAVTITRKLYLGTPIVATTNRIVTTTSMKVGSYTVAAQPDVPRNVTVTVTAVSTADTMGTVLVSGTDINDVAITETLTPAAGSTVAGAKAFKTVTSVVGSGWVVNSGADSVVFGVGSLIGLPVSLASGGTSLYTLGTAVAVGNTTGTGLTSTSTVDASGSTYDGSKKLFVYIDR